MLRHAVACAVAVTLVLLATLLPFLPGPYDPLAGPLSMAARVFGFAGLLLVPFGAIWLARPQGAAGVALVVVFGLVWGLVSLAALASAGLSLCALMLLGGVFLIRQLTAGVKSRTRAAGLYTVAVPLTAFVLQLALVPRAVEFSRDLAIRNASPLIADIERYRAERGAYAPSMLAVWPDYKPSVIGIERYHYEPSGDSFNLAFEQVARELSAREFVVYNPRDEQVFTSHASHLLQFPPDRLGRARGYFAVHDAAHAHWKYFWFD